MKTKVKNESQLPNVNDFNGDSPGVATDSDRVHKEEQGRSDPEKGAKGNESMDIEGENEISSIDNGKELTSEEKIKNLKLDVQEANDKMLRSRAEFENYRKRMQRELTEARLLGKTMAIEEIFPIMDHFKMAMSASDSSNDLASLKEGMKLIQAEFDRCFKNLGLDAIPTEGQRFDPNLHEAVSTEQSAEIEEGFVIREWKAGYRIGDRVLRPAFVVVSSGPEETQKS